MLSDQLGHPSESWHKASTDHHTCIPIKSKWTVWFTDARFAHPSVSDRIMSRKMIFTTLSLDHFSSFPPFLSLFIIFTMLDHIVSNSSGGTQNQHWFCFFLLLSGSGWNITALRLTTGNSQSHLVPRHWCHKVVHLCSEADPNRAMSKRDSLITIVIPFAIHLFPGVLWNKRQICLCWTCLWRLKKNYPAEKACWKYLQQKPKLLPCLSESLLHETGLLICPSSGAA